MFQKLLFLFVIGFATTQIQAHECSIKSEKTYIASNCIQIENDAIFIFLNNNWVQAPVLYSDPQGVYVYTNEIKLLPWLCSNCNRWTTGWFCCEHCGALPDNS